ncbi:MAG: glycosyl transferase family 4 [Candidatus Pacearchaeota archaeon]
MEYLILFPVMLSFFLTLIILPKWIKKAHEIGLKWKDCNKNKEVYVAGSGGIIVLFVFVISTLLYVAIKTFYFKTTENVIEILALLTSILLLGMTGLIDDLLGWHRKGLSKRIRIFLCIISAIPLMVINIKNGYGFFYLLFIVPIGITGCATTFNFLAGMNGLEARQGILLLGALAIASYFTNVRWVSLIALTMISSLIAFLFYNKYPAKIFPGDILTYSVGGLIAIIAILSRLEKFALFIFIPYFIEVFLKLRGNLEKQSFGKPKKDNSLDLLYDKIYSLNHLAIILLKKIKPSKKVYERDVVLAINIFQIIIIIIAFIIFRNHIFG